MLNHIRSSQGEGTMSVLKSAVFCLAVLLAVALSTAADAQVQVLKTFPVNTMEGVITQSDVSVDKEASPTTGGCLKITATKPQTVRLFEVTGLDVENATLVYKARVRTKDASDVVYLEMWCRFPGKGEFFSRGLDRPLTGTTGWTEEGTPFFLQKGQKPDLVRLNVVISGTGTVWVDDVKLIKEALR
jgi:hypothetical protein